MSKITLAKMQLAKINGATVGEVQVMAKTWTLEERKVALLLLAFRKDVLTMDAIVGLGILRAGNLL